MAADWNATYCPLALIDGAIRLSPLPGLPSGATVIIATTPAVAAAGDAIPKVSEFEVFDPSFTVICTAPGLAINEVEMVALKI